MIYLIVNFSRMLQNKKTMRLEERKVVKTSCSHQQVPQTADDFLNSDIQRVDPAGARFSYQLHPRKIETFFRQIHDKGTASFQRYVLLPFLTSFDIKKVGTLLTILFNLIDPFASTIFFFVGKPINLHSKVKLTLIQQKDCCFSCKNFLNIM